MSGFAFVFVILPCIAAVIMGWLLFDWRLAAAALCGALALVFLTPSLPASIKYVSLPVTVGAALGALTVLIVLLIRPVSDKWSRMIWALSVTFAASFIHLISTPIGA